MILLHTFLKRYLNFPNNLLQAIYNKLEEKKSYEIASIDKNLYRSSIKITDEESITNYYNKNKDKYIFDERRSFTYIFPNLDKIKKRIEISDEEILSLYNNQKEDKQVSIVGNKQTRTIISTLFQSSYLIKFFYCNLHFLRNSI